MMSSTLPVVLPGTVTGWLIFQVCVLEAVELWLLEVSTFMLALMVDSSTSGTFSVNEIDSPTESVDDNVKLDEAVVASLNSTVLVCSLWNLLSTHWVKTKPFTPFSFVVLMFEYLLSVTCVDLAIHLYL